jgi:hypothetical protein
MLPRHPHRIQSRRIPLNQEDKHQRLEVNRRHQLVLIPVLLHSQRQHRHKEVVEAILKIPFQLSQERLQGQLMLLTRAHLNPMRADSQSNPMDQDLAKDLVPTRVLAQVLAQVPSRYNHFLRQETHQWLTQLSCHSQS